MIPKRTLRLGVLVALGATAACSLERLGAAPSGELDAGVDTGSGGSLVDDGGFGGVGGATDASPEADAPTPTLPYAFRRRLRLTPGASAVPAGASVTFRFDHRALVLSGKARGDGKDVRVFYKASGPSQELDRVLDPVSGWDRTDTALWFRAQAEISAPDGSYYLYYGDPSPSEPPESPNQVYAFFDDFDGNALASGWVGAPIGNASGTFTVGNGVVRIEGATGDVWNSGDDFLFLHRSMTGNFVLDALVTGSGGSASGWAKLGGLMVRDGTSKGAKNRLIAPVNGSVAITSSYRLAADTATQEATKPGAKLVPQFVRLARRFDGARAWHSADGVDFAELGSETTFATVLPDSVLVGIPLANMTAGKGWVDVDWFRVRVLVEAEPSVSEDPEEPGPFSP
ncbi:MAG: DUF2341 domain-containing protein [Myxococcales bacterium]|nr:DUF2341 domain-containing protein [Myxococcales bacterium]